VLLAGVRFVSLGRRDRRHGKERPVLRDQTAGSDGRETERHKAVARFTPARNDRPVRQLQELRSEVITTAR
jgi:hypothetical protein